MTDDNLVNHQVLVEQQYHPQQQLTRSFHPNHHPGHGGQQETGFPTINTQNSLTIHKDDDQMVKALNFSPTVLFQKKVLVHHRPPPDTPPPDHRSTTLEEQAGILITTSMTTTPVLRSPTISQSSLVLRPLDDLSIPGAEINNGDVFGPIPNLVRWLYTELVKIEKTFQKDQEDEEEVHAEEDDEFVDDGTKLTETKILFQKNVGLALNKMEKNLEIFFHQEQYYFEAVRTFRVISDKHPPLKQQSNKILEFFEAKKKPSHQPNMLFHQQQQQQQMLAVERPKAWFCREMEQKLLFKPSRTWINGKEVFYCMFCNHFSFQFNHIMLHMMLNCPKIDDQHLTSKNFDKEKTINNKQLEVDSIQPSIGTNDLNQGIDQISSSLATHSERDRVEQILFQSTLSNNNNNYSNNLFEQRLNGDDELEELKKERKKVKSFDIISLLNNSRDDRNLNDRSEARNHHHHHHLVTMMKHLDEDNDDNDDIDVESLDVVMVDETIDRVFDCHRMFGPPLPTPEFGGLVNRKQLNHNNHQQNKQQRFQAENVLTSSLKMKNGLTTTTTPNHRSNSKAKTSRNQSANKLANGLFNNRTMMNGKNSSRKSSSGKHPPPLPPPLVINKNNNGQMDLSDGPLSLTNLTNQLYQQQQLLNRQCSSSNISLEQQQPVYVNQQGPSASTVSSSNSQQILFNQTFANFFQPLVNSCSTHNNRTNSIAFTTTNSNTTPTSTTSFHMNQTTDSSNIFPSLFQTLPASSSSGSPPFSSFVSHIVSPLVPGSRLPQPNPRPTMGPASNKIAINDFPSQPSSSSTTISSPASSSLAKIFNTHPPPNLQPSTSGKQVPPLFENTTTNGRQKKSRSLFRTDSPTLSESSLSAASPYSENPCQRLFGEPSCSTSASSSTSSNQNNNKKLNNATTKESNNRSPSSSSTTEPMRPLQLLPPIHSNNPLLNLPPYFMPPTTQASSNPLITSLYLLSPSLTALSYQASNVCAYCNTAFRMTSDLVYHMRSHHKKTRTNQDNQTTMIDGKRKKRDDQLRCHICDETFRERHHLTRHMTSHQ